MKQTNFHTPVLSSWFDLNGRRLDAKPYLSGAMEAKALLEKLQIEKKPLHLVTKSGLNGIFNGPRFSRTYVDDPNFGISFLGSTDILAADLSTLPLLSKKIVQHYPNLLIKDGWTLISCSGTIGRMAYSRSDQGFSQMVGRAHIE